MSTAAAIVHVVYQRFTELLPPEGFPLASIAEPAIRGGGWGPLGNGMSASWIRRPVAGWRNRYVPSWTSDSAPASSVEELVQPRVGSLADSGGQVLATQDVEDVGRQIGGSELISRSVPLDHGCCHRYSWSPGSPGRSPCGRHGGHQTAIHEAGLCQGRLGFERAIILLEDGCAEFSNIHGLGQIRFPKGNISAKFQEIRNVLEREGIIPRLPYGG